MKIQQFIEILKRIEEKHGNLLIQCHCGEAGDFEYLYDHPESIGVTENIHDGELTLFLEGSINGPEEKE